MVPEKPANIKKTVRCFEGNAHYLQQQLSPIAAKKPIMRNRVLDNSEAFYNLVGVIPQLGLAATVSGKFYGTIRYKINI
jgi:hypothetical protein